MQARYCIFRVLLEAGDGLLHLSGTGADTRIALDRAKIATVHPNRTLIPEPFILLRFLAFPRYALGFRV